MSVNWTAVITGFVVTITLGFISGLVYAGSGASVVMLYWSGIGLFGGLAAGYVVGPTGSGALHGGLATVFGSLVMLVLASFTTLLFGGLVASLGVFTFGLFILAVYAIPGAVGGALRSWLKDRRSAPTPTGGQA